MRERKKKPTENELLRFEIKILMFRYSHVPVDSDGGVTFIFYFFEKVRDVVSVV